MLRSNKVTDLHPVVDALAVEHKSRADALFIARGFVGVTMCIYETLRDKSYQLSLWKQGRTKPGKIITMTLNSPHLYGIAYDAAPMKSGKILWNREDLFKIIVEAGKGLVIDSRFAGKMNSGGTWNKFTDWPHHEFLGGLSYSDFAAGKRPIWWGENPLKQSISPKEPVAIKKIPYKVGVVTCDVLNMREKPDAKAKILKILKKDDRVRIYGIKNGFFDLNTGFASTKYINIEGKK